MHYKTIVLSVASFFMFISTSQAAISFATNDQSIVIKGDIYNRGNVAVNTDTTDSGFMTSIAPKQFSTLFAVTLSPTNQFKRVIYKNANGSGCVF